MDNQEHSTSNWSDRLKDRYKLVVFTADTFREVRAFNLSLRSIYVTLSIVSLALLVLAYLIFGFTPLKRTIPGYGDIEYNSDYLKVIEKVDDISAELEAQETYLAGLKNLLTIPLEGDAPNFKVPEQTLNSKRQSSPTGNLKESVKIDPINIDSDRNIYSTLLKSKVVLPVQGIVSSKFKPEIKHYGVDILAPKNSPISVMMDGYVFSSGWELETGYTIGIQHEGNILSFYKHNSILLKEKGTFVKAGEAVAIIGNTGTLSNGPHLHFELWHSGKPVNPEDFLNFK